MATMKFKICPKCGQAFSVTTAGLELLYSHLLREHLLPADEADKAVDEAATDERVVASPRDLPRCH